MYSMFNNDHALEYGLHEALVIHHLQRVAPMVGTTHTVQRFHDKILFCMTVEELQHFHPYLSASGCTKALKNLVSRGVLRRAGQSDWYEFVDQDNFISARAGRPS